ncbi:DUF2332 domain-containing protein [Virgibacillus kekensis]|uniref:DUF2332 domain-containing protein n=1 Tax=Virgibacillus kekensis TaxID=202261 RepID=A0ABV9DMF7_9BACI
MYEKKWGSNKLDKSTLAMRFKSFSEKECKGSSRLYEHLASKVADDEYLLSLCSYVREGQPVPNMLFGAVHYLLLKGESHELADYYPSLTDSPGEPRDAFPSFKNFCKIHQEEIIPLMKHKLVQTNEVRRTGYLYPAFCFIYEKIKKPLALIEIGTSAGLQLFWDQYSYSYGSDQIYGNRSSEVHIDTEVRGNNFPFLLSESPPVISRTGLDLHINDVTDPEDYLWLKALIWPEHVERRKLFECAANYVNTNSVSLIEGDGITMLPETARDIPVDAAIVVFHTHVANQLSYQAKANLLRSIKDISGEREIFHLYNNIQDTDLHLDYFINSKEYKNKAGETDGHGRWFTWELE